MNDRIIKYDKLEKTVKHPRICLQSEKAIKTLGADIQNHEPLKCDVGMLTTKN
jgi:hypothetical protein